MPTSAKNSTWTLRRSQAGFSLIEVTLSLGLLGFTLVGLMGLIPVGLKTFDSAIDATVETQITQSIGTRARETKFTSLASLNRRADDNGPTPDYFFDDQGQELDSSNGAPASYIYAAAVVICNDPLNPYTNYPGTTGGGSPQPVQNGQIATVKIVVTKSTAPGQSRVSFLHIANNGL